METIDSAFPEFQASVLDGKRAGDRLLAPLCGLLAFIFYWLLTPHCLPPGPATELTAAAMGLPAQTPPFHLLWNVLATLAAALPVGTMTNKLALLSAVCSAIAASLVYHVSVELMMHRLIPNGTGSDRLKMRALQIGSVVGALAFATASPAALSATRASLRILDVVLLLLTIWLFLRYCDGGNVGNLLLSGVVCGLGMGETPGCYVAFAVVLLWGIILLWRQDRSTLPMLAFAGLALALLLLVYPGLCHLWHVPGGGIVQLLAAHCREILADYATSRTVMFLGALSLLPLILALATMRQTLNYGEDYESLLTLAALSTAALLVLTNAFTVFRSYILNSPEPPVLPHLFAALTAGFVSAGWWAIALCSFATEEDAEADLDSAATPPIVQGFGYVAAIAIAAGVLFSGFLTVGVLRGRPDWYPQSCAETILRDLGARRWLFGRTPVNSQLAVLARDRRLPLQVVPLTAEASWSPGVRQGLKSSVAHDEIFAGLDRNQLSDALALGPDVFLRVWLLTDPRAADKLVIAGPPLTWTSCGTAAIPAAFFFSGGARPHTPARDVADQMLQAAQTLRRAKCSGFADGTMQGILLSAEQTLSASAAYAVAAYSRAGATTAAATLTSCFAEPRAPPPERRSLFAAPLAWLWETTVLPARPECADILHTIRGRELLAALEQKDDSPVARRASTVVARSGRASGDFTELYALARTSADLALVNQTFSCLAQLDQNGAPPDDLLALRAEATLAITNDVAQADALLQEATAKFPRDLWAWHLLVVARLQRGDCNGAERELLPAMARAAGDETNDMVRLTHALILCARGDPSRRAARNLFADIADANPDLPVAREWALRLDALLNDDTDAARDAKILIAGDANHAQANYTLALLAVRSHQLAEADRCFRQSLSGAMTPQALVGRARIYCQRRMYTEALQFATKATTEYPSYPDGWIVLGDAYEATGNPGEAAVVRSRATAREPVNSKQ